MRTKQNRNIENIVKNVTATLAIEGLKPSKDAVAINRQFLEGKISSKEAVSRIKAKYAKVLVK
mgnify:CR=1 FL=1|jgi:hypothetical protein